MYEVHIHPNSIRAHLTLTQSILRKRIVGISSFSPLYHIDKKNPTRRYFFSPSLARPWLSGRPRLHAPLIYIHFRCRHGMRARSRDGPAKSPGESPPGVDLFRENVFRRHVLHASTYMHTYGGSTLHAHRRAKHTHARNPKINMSRKYVCGFARCYRSAESFPRRIAPASSFFFCFLTFRRGCNAAPTGSGSLSSARLLSHPSF